ncbi:hypothetical protein EMCRGX_G000068 [Ephydatia muelleri]
MAETCRRAHFSVQVEAGCNLTPDHSHSRPADVLISNWALGKTAACDISVTSPLNSNIMSEAGVTAGAAAQATELRKHEANDVKCSELGWLCIPLVVESYGAWGKEAMESFSSLASRLAITSSRPKSAVLSELYGRLNLNLGCQALIAPSMWRIHMEGHVRGTFCGMVPDTWLNDQNLYICHHCSSLVAISHKSSHIKKCLKCPPSPESPVATPLTNASGDDLPSLRDICNLKCPTIRFIPNKAKPAFARVLSAALRAVITENSIGSWIKLFMLPKCVLPCSKRRGRHNKPIPLEVLCDMWTDGHFGDLWSRAVKHATCTSKSYSLHPKVDPGRRKVASAISLAQDGLFGKACQVLTSSGVAPNNDDTWNLLISKHPSSACPAIPLPSNRDFTFPPDLSLMDILRSFPKLTAAGPSGLRIQHLIDAAEVPLQTPLLHTLRAVINLLISGSAPLDVAIFLAGGNLTALNKPVPGDIRPIAVGEALRRLTGKCLCAALRSKMASFFEPYQFGVAFPCGAEKIAHGLRTCIEQHWSENDFGVLKVDKCI